MQIEFHSGEIFSVFSPYKTLFMKALVLESFNEALSEAANSFPSNGFLQLQ